ncbi:MAG: DUF6452 family protein [Bacteroidales bacterium]|nr:DUF6452 family protein [Bacteroidales bacterium]
MAIAISLCLAAGCNTSGCLENQNSIPLAGFYSSSTLTAISIDSVAIGGVGAPRDSLLSTGATAISQLYLPFRATDSSTSYFFRYISQGLNYDFLVDTITFTYDTHLYFASEECGAMYRYYITEMTHTTHLIDSVAITDSLVTNLDVERIKIFFRTANPDEEEEEETEEEPSQGDDYSEDDTEE